VHKQYIAQFSNLHHTSTVYHKSCKVTQYLVRGDIVNLTLNLG